MNPAVAEWVAKAEGDFVTAGRELRSRKSPNYDSACFHCQQCAEKYLKAILQEQGVRIPKIHLLLELLALIIKFDESYELLKANLEILEDYAVRFRYPGDFAKKDQAQEAYEATEILRVFVRQKLRLE
jgi:HEPN domain-containing protein